MRTAGISGPVVIQIPGDPKALFLVRCVVERLANALGFSEQRVIRLVQAVDEACSNVIKHGYGGPTRKPLTVTFLVSRERLEIQIQDLAPAPDPQSLIPRDLRQLRPGGLGLHLIRAGADEVSYEPNEGGTGCLLRLVINRDPGGRRP